MLSFYSFASHKIIPCKPALALDGSQGWPWGMVLPCSNPLPCAAALPWELPQPRCQGSSCNKAVSTQNRSGVNGSIWDPSLEAV